MASSWTSPCPHCRALPPPTESLPRASNRKGRHARLKTRSASDLETPGHYGRRGHHARARNRRKHRHLQCRGRGAAAPACVQGTGALVTILHTATVRLRPPIFWTGIARAKASNMAAAEAWGGTFTGSGRPENVAGLRMGEGLMQILGIAPLLGRRFQPDDFTPGNQDVLILSYRLWQRRFGGSPKILGQDVALDGRDSSVIGVMPAGFRFPSFLPTRAQYVGSPLIGDRASDRGGSTLRVFARLKAGRLDRARRRLRWMPSPADWRPPSRDECGAGAAGGSAPVRRSSGTSGRRF